MAVGILGRAGDAALNRRSPLRGRSIARCRASRARSSVDCRLRKPVGSRLPAGPFREYLGSRNVLSV